MPAAQKPVNAMEMGTTFLFNIVPRFSGLRNRILPFHPDKTQNIVDGPASAFAPFHWL